MTTRFRVRLRRALAAVGLVALLAALPHASEASSHREAPFVTQLPKVDGTDFYAFRSYEPGREDYVTFVANYIPLQDPYGAPNYFTLDANALYEIHIDNNGDAQEDLTFQFRANNTTRDIQIPVGPPGSTACQLLPGIGFQAKTVFYGIQQVRCHDLRFIRGFNYCKTALA